MIKFYHKSLQHPMNRNWFDLAYRFLNHGACLVISSCFQIISTLIHPLHLSFITLWPHFKQAHFAAQLLDLEHQITK